MLDRLHPAAVDPVPGRHDAARTADRPVLQDGAERSVRGARRAQLPVPGVPRQARPDRSAVPGPGGLRADRQQPVARSAGAVRDAGRRTAEHCRPTSSRSSRRVRTTTRAAVRAAAAGCAAGPGPGAERAVPAAGAAEATPTARRRRGRTPRRRRCRPAGGPRRRHRRPAPAGAVPAAREAVGPPAAAPPPQATARRPPRTIRGPACSDPAGGTGVFAAGRTTAPAENWVDLMLDPRQV